MSRALLERGKSFSCFHCCGVHCTTRTKKNKYLLLQLALSHPCLRHACTDLPASQGGGQAVVKVWCLPYDKVHGTFQWKCQKMDLAVRANQFLMAQQAVITECGLLDTTIRVRGMEAGGRPML